MSASFVEYRQQGYKFLIIEKEDDIKKYNKSLRKYFDLNPITNDLYIWTIMVKEDNGKFEYRLVNDRLAHYFHDASEMKYVSGQGSVDFDENDNCESCYMAFFRNVEGEEPIFQHSVRLLDICIKTSWVDNNLDEVFEKFPDVDGKYWLNCTDGDDDITWVSDEIIQEHFNELEEADHVVGIKKNGKVTIKYPEFIQHDENNIKMKIVKRMK